MSAVSGQREGKRLLVVDDEPPMRAALKRALELGGFEVSLAADGSEGLARARELTPDLVVLDVLMPGVDGLGVCRALREGGDRTPILMLTARDAVADRVDGLEAGADDYLVKPFALEELLARIRALLRRANGPDRSNSSSARSPAGSPASSGGSSGRSRTCSRTRSSGVRPGARIEVELDQGELRIRDHGPGIKAEDLAHVFDRSAAARGMAGSGLGLAIVRQVAESHGGSVRAANAPGGGALLVMRLPTVPAPAAVAV